MSGRPTADIEADLRRIADAISVNIDLMNTAAFYREAADRLAELDATVDRLTETLSFYADPGTYHACAFRFDRPAGGFDDDFSVDHGDEFYDRAMPGKLAREALRVVWP